jgi:ATP-dependent Zn protease
VTDERYQRGTAYHEAGHAVVAWSLGLEVGTISVLADDASGGVQIGSADHLNLVEEIAVCAAGYTAENTFDYHTHY